MPVEAKPLFRPDVLRPHLAAFEVGQRLHVVVSHDALQIELEGRPHGRDGDATHDREVARVQARASAGKHVVLVDMYSAFVSDANYKDTLFADRLHPNDSGYALMAKVWYEALAPFLH